MATGFASVGYFYSCYRGAFGRPPSSERGREARQPVGTGKEA